VAATQGETIAERPEVLGSGDGTQPNQRFFLKKPPLTYTSAATVTGIASSLEVRVNGLLWQSVSALYNLQPIDQVYLVQIEDDGSTSITFGDGINGARLPSGLDNVVATYRSGIGITGNLAPGKLSLLKTRPLGIQAVINLLPATGAANPESRDEIRDRAPLMVRTLDRVISLRDVEDFTRTFPGIGKAQAVSLWVTHSAVIHVTIAGSDGAEISPDAALYQNLVQAIEQVRDPYQSPPVVTSYQQIGFDLAATLLIDACYLPERVEATVQEKLQQTFAFANREFGQPVTAAEVIALIQTIDGVIAVDLDFLYRVTAPKTLEQCLIAKLAQWHPDTQQFSPAQLLTLHNASLTAHLSNSGQVSNR
jgi:predicted phage baseplate assembly protein